jgi:hypothetical protein
MPHQRCASSWLKVQSMKQRRMSPLAPSSALHWMGQEEVFRNPVGAGFGDNSKKNATDACRKEHMALLRCYQGLHILAGTTCSDEYKVFWDCYNQQLGIKEQEFFVVKLYNKIVDRWSGTSKDSTSTPDADEAAS